MTIRFKAFLVILIGMVVNVACVSWQSSPPPVDEVVSFYHDKKDGKKNYENTRIQDIDKEGGIVMVTTIDSEVQMTIIFKPTPENLEKFHIGWIAPITFQCTKSKKGKCDFNSSYKLFVSNGLVEVKQLIFPKTTPR